MGPENVTAGKGVQIALPPSTAVTGYRDIAICARRLRTILMNPKGRKVCLSYSNCFRVCEFLGLGLTSEESKLRSRRLCEQRLKMYGSGWHDPATNSPDMHPELNGWRGDVVWWRPLGRRT